MKDLPDRANWRRFPTTGHPGGPGGRFGDLGLVLVLWRRRAVRRKARKVRKRLEEEEGK